MTIRTRINLSIINENSIDKYPISFIKFCEEKKLRMPSLFSAHGKALAAMLNHPDYYWTRDDCNEFCRRFHINSKDSIQLFNKHEQWGPTQSSEKGKYYIVVPYMQSIKSQIRKNFNFSGTVSERNNMIDTIKQNIMNDYINVPNEKWQLGHKNPGCVNLSEKNMVLQPPIQAKYRDDYIFMDSITKMPSPKKLKKMMNQGECPYTDDQLYEIYNILKTQFEK